MVFRDVNLHLYSANQLKKYIPFQSYGFQRCQPAPLQRQPVEKVHPFQSYGFQRCQPAPLHPGKDISLRRPARASAGLLSAPYFVNDGNPKTCSIIKTPAADGGPWWRTDVMRYAAVSEVRVCSPQNGGGDVDVRVVDVDPESEYGTGLVRRCRLTSG